LIASPATGVDYHVEIAAQPRADPDVQRHERIVAERRVQFDDAIELRVAAAQHF
jgi:hypothetical protein